MPTPAPRPARPGTKPAPAAPPAAPTTTPGAIGDQLRSANYDQGRQMVSPKPRYGPTRPDSAPAAKGPAAGEYKAPQQLDDPALARDDKTKDRETHEYKRYEGKLFHRGVRAQDISQGWLSDCYLAAALAAVAQRHPDVIRAGIVDRGGDVYAVRFYQLDWRGKAKEEWVEVDADFPWYQDKNTWAYLQSTQKGELWPSLVEKAYAKWKAGGAGDYDEIGQGGWEGDVMEAMTGLPADSETVSAVGQDDALWKRLQDAAAAGKAMTAGTFDDKHGADTRFGDATGIYGNHAYTVMGVRTKGRGKAAQRMVQLRNPWGSGEPTNNGKDDGIFEITLAEFRDKYETLTTLG